MNLTNMSIQDMAEALRPDLAGLLIQRLAPLNDPLPVITFSSGLRAYANWHGSPKW